LFFFCYILFYLDNHYLLNSIETAAREINLAIDYLESNGITSGYTSILFKTPGDSVEWWYNNLKRISEELELRNSSDKYQLLIKLHQMNLSGPEGISVFPDNKKYFFFGLVSFLLYCIGFILGNIRL
jgi:hypothetical protein